MQSVWRNHFVSLPKQPTHIPGFDLISEGGLPEGRTTLISGTSGSGKTVFAAQFLAAGILHCDQPGVFVTFEERPEDIRLNMQGLGWPIHEWEEQGKWAFVDASPEPGDVPVYAGSYDLGALLARIENAASRTAAKRVVIDSLGGIYSQVQDHTLLRHELFRIAGQLKQLKLTGLITAERTEEYGSIARHGVEEFVSDNVLVLRNILEMETRRRTIEILKFRGANHQKGEFPFSVIPETGIVIIPLSGIELKQGSTNLRIPSGNPVLDQMCGGGFFRDSIILVSGPTGTGKTLVTTEFLAGGIKQNERCLLFAFEESREQLFRNAHGWGMDFDQLESEGLLKVVCDYPEACAMEDHLIRIKKHIEEFQPQRVAVDSLSALERVATPKAFREFVIGVTSFIKHLEITGLFTAATQHLFGGTSVTETHISTITDSIILLRYVEIFGQIRRGLSVLKMRGSGHDKEIREFTIDNSGMRIGKAFKNISGILSGNLVQLTQGELDRMSDLFNDSSNP